MATTARPGRFSACANHSRSTTPFASTGRTSTGAPAFAAASATHGCSVADTINRSQPAASALAMPWALASVPPLLNTTAVGSAPTSSPTCARAVSTRALARLPAAWTAEGLPLSARALAMISSTSGRTRPEAL